MITIAIKVIIAKEVSVAFSLIFYLLLRGEKAALSSFIFYPVSAILNSNYYLSHFNHPILITPLLLLPLLLNY